MAIHTDVGRVRDNNEDAAGLRWLGDGALFVIVADGMGGHESGEVASGLAVQVVGDFVDDLPEADPRERLYDGLLEANRVILSEGDVSGTRGMGTTAVAAILRGSKVFVGLVGDSRLYHIRKGQLVWRTLDHTRVQSLIDKGLIEEDEAREHPEAGMLTRALGHSRMANGEELVPDVFEEPLELEPDDAVLMCSDGLHDLIEDWEIGQLVAGREPSDAARHLVEEACERGGHDNITVAVITAGSRAADYDPQFAPEPGWLTELEGPERIPTDPAPWLDPPLEAEVEMEVTREAPRTVPPAEAEPPRRGWLFGLAAVSILVMTGVAAILLALALGAAWYFSQLG